MDSVSVSIKRSALITGITGQDGAYLAELLIEKGYVVHGMRRRTSIFNSSRIDHLLEKYPQSLKLYYGDMLDELSIITILKESNPDEIYNLAAQSHVDVSFYQPIYTADVVGLGVLRLLECIKKLSLFNSSKLYQASSSEMFGEVLETPQTEKTQFNARSPYAIAKVFAHQNVLNFREAYNYFAVSGILFNHESPLRGETFVTRKITRGLSRIKHGLQDVLYLGNLDAKRDWGHAKDYVYMQWLMMQQEKPKDYVIATGKHYSVREFVNLVASEMDFDLVWEGEGLNEYAADKQSGKVLIRVSEAYYRPTDVETLLGDASLAKKELGWSPKYDINTLIKEMLERDLRDAHYEANR